MVQDTIAAISTGIGNAGIGIIRVSGSESVAIVDRIFCGSIRLCDAPSHSVNYGHIASFGDECIADGGLDDDGAVTVMESKSSHRYYIDEVLVTVFRAPRSYTREDVVEISSHGGAFVLKQILRQVFLAGARPADPGEFTKRAFLNGRIDLSQAESVMDIIASDNDRMLSNSLSQLSGALSERIRLLREEILHEIAFMEAALDDPEHYDLDDVYRQHLSELVDTWRGSIGKLTASVRDGRLMRDGVRTVIVGRPNAGKSSLLNALAGTERAIVTDIPGTTRDAIEEKIRLHDLVLAVTDTAGIRDTDNLVEQLGVEKSLREMEQADLILYMVDINEPLQDEDGLIVGKLDMDKTLLLLNKVDKMLKNSSIIEDFFTANPVFPTELKDRAVLISAKEQSGFQVLADRIHQLIDMDFVDNHVDIYITNERHAHLLRAAEVSLQYVEKSIHDCMPEDLLTGDLMDAYESLGFIIGESLEDDLVDKIFSDFCMGK